MIKRQIPDGMRYTAIPDDTTLDFRLSHLDYRVLSHLMSKTEDWNVYATYISDTFKISDKTARSVLLNLIKFGYGTPIVKNGHRVDIALTPVKQTPLVSKLPHPTPGKLDTTGSQITAPPVNQIPVPPGKLDTSKPTPRYPGYHPPGNLDTNPPVKQIPTLVSNLPPTESRSYSISNTQSVSTQSESQSLDESVAPPPPASAPSSPQLAPPPQATSEYPLTSGIVKTAKGGVSFADSEEGTAALNKFMDDNGIDFMPKDTPPNLSLLNRPGLIRASNVHLYRSQRA